MRWPTCAPRSGQGGTHHANEFHLCLPVLQSALPLQVTSPHLGGTHGPGVRSLEGLARGGLRVGWVGVLG